MKTNAIREVLGKDKNGDVLILYLDALETALAEKDNALGELIGADLHYDVSPKNDSESESRRIEAIKAAGVAISDHIPDATKKVLVDDETIRGIRDTLQDLMDVQNGCPLPKYQEEFDRANDAAVQLIDRLGNLLKEER